MGLLKYKNRQDGDRDSVSLPGILILIAFTFLAILIFQLHSHVAFGSNNTASIELFRRKLTPSIATIRRDLGIACHPQDCNKIEFLRNLAFLSTQELDVYVSLKEHFNHLEMQATELNDDAVFVQSTSRADSRYTLDILVMVYVNNRPPIVYGIYQAIYMPYRKCQ